MRGETPRRTARGFLVARVWALRCATCVWGVFLAAIGVLLGERVEPCCWVLSRARVLFSYGVVEVFWWLRSGM